METGIETRRALPKHKTGTSDAPFDGPANEARLKKDQPEAYYRSAYAWRDPEGDAAKKSSYKFIHHFIAGDGKVGDASVRACRSGIAILNGARGGADIPDADRQGVWNHLAGHLRDADVEPPPLRSRPQELERRAFPACELRVDEGGKQPKIIGHAAVFNKLSVPIFGFREKVLPGAFKKTLQESDIRALWNHDPNFILGRNKADTLELSEDERGLRTVIAPPDTQWARDLLESIRRGDVSQMSFGFRTIKDTWHTEDGGMVRELHEVRLFDVSPVAFPAYEDTDVQVRALAYAAGGNELLCGALLRLNAGEDLGTEEMDLVRGHVEALTERLAGTGPTARPVAAEPGRSDAHHSAEPGPVRAHHSEAGGGLDAPRETKDLRRRLELLAAEVL